MEQNQRSEFEQLVEDSRVVIERFINFRMPCTHDADDVIQNTYLAAFRHFAALREKALFKQWLLAIAKNECNLYYRRKYRHDEIPLEAAEDISDERDENTGAIVTDTLAGMSYLLSTVLSMYYIEGKSQKEISALLGIPVGTVKSRLFKAKNQFRSACPPQIRAMYEKGEKKMEYALNFPKTMPELKIRKKNVPFFEVKCEEQSFIIPRVGNRCSEATYRYPDKTLLLASSCYVPKEAVIHGVEGVKICRDTLNVRSGRLAKNEAVWFAQLTDEYIRNLASVQFDGDNEYPTAIYSFLEEDYDVTVNGNDRIHGMPLLLKENPATEDNNGIHIDQYNVRYTMGVFDVTLDKRTFETIKYIIVQKNTVFSGNYIDRNGRTVLMRWYESPDSIGCDDNYPSEYVARIQNNARVWVNGSEFIHIEDRFSEYVL